MIEVAQAVLPIVIVFLLAWLLAHFAYWRERCQRCELYFSLIDKSEYEFWAASWKDLNLELLKNDKKEIEALEKKLKANEQEGRKLIAIDKKRGHHA